ncbi:MAG: DUF4363 family protein [Clostridia bacterium]|nr:DUF4363 family protein [Clostridia bacterium]
MKKGIFALIILLLILGLGIGELFYLNHTYNTMKDRMSEVRNMIEREDAESYTAVVSAKEWWNEKKALLETLVSHNETKEMTLRLSELEGYVAIDDQKSAVATVAIIIELCENTVNTLYLDWDTIM